MKRVGRQSVSSPWEEAWLSLPGLVAIHRLGGRIVVNLLRKLFRHIVLVTSTCKHLWLTVWWRFLYQNEKKSRFHDHLPARREGHRDRAHVQLIEVPSGCIMVLSLTKRLYLIDVHFVPIASFAYKEQTAKDELACEEEYRKNNLCTNRMDSCAWWCAMCLKK